LKGVVEELDLLRTESGNSEELAQSSWYFLG
jgi:hypothetical protein